MHIVASVVPRLGNSMVVYCWIKVLVPVVLLSITVQHNLVAEHDASVNDNNRDVHTFIWKFKNKYWLVKKCSGYPEPHCGLASPVHHVLYLFSPQLLPVLIVPRHNGMARRNWPVWLVTYWCGLSKHKHTQYYQSLTKSNSIDWDQCVTIKHNYQLSQTTSQQSVLINWQLDN